MPASGANGVAKGDGTALRVVSAYCGAVAESDGRVIGVREGKAICNVRAAREVLSVRAISAAVAPVRFAKAARRAAISPIIASSVRTAFGSVDEASAHESQAARTGAAAGAIAPENRYALVASAGNGCGKQPGA